MPITDVSSYLPTMDEFVAHWRRLNAELVARGEPDAVLRDGCKLQQFIAARATLESALRRVSQAVAQCASLEEERAYLAERLRCRMLRLRDLLSHGDPDQPPISPLHDLPLSDPLDSRYLGRLDDASDFWQSLAANPHAASPAGAATAIRDDAAQFRALCRDLRRARRALAASRAGLQVLCNRIMTWLTSYRCLVRFELTVSGELLHSLPARTPTSYRPRPT